MPKMAQYTRKWLLITPSDHLQSETLFQTRQDQERGMNGHASLFHSWHWVLFCFCLYFVGVWCAWTEHSAFEHIKVECEIFNLIIVRFSSDGHWPWQQASMPHFVFLLSYVNSIGPIPYAHYGSLCLPQISRLLMVLWEDIEWKSWIKSSGWFDQSYSKAQSALNCAPRS